MENGILLNKNLRVNDAAYVGEHQFACGHQVPVFEVSSIHSLNQLVGHVKFNNREYGNVYYRGECHLHDNLYPSLVRNRKNYCKAEQKLISYMDHVQKDSVLSNILKLTKDIGHNKHKIEAVLQHYGVPTRYIDIVDNHWVALWMGLYKCKKYSMLQTYFHYEKREIPFAEFATKGPIEERDFYQYVLLIGVPFGNSSNKDGVYESDNYVEVDLRDALPSVFLRPHAQHGIVVRKKIHDDRSYDYNMATDVLGILKARIDKVSLWLGDGSLLSQENLFPSAAYDTGYGVLLSKSDVFDCEDFGIAKYV